MARKKASKRILDCTIQRVMVIRYGTLNLVSGEYIAETGSRETVTRNCNAPLFTDIEIATGVCSGCAEGWTHPENNFASGAEQARAAEAHSAYQAQLAQSLDKPKNL